MSLRRSSLERDRVVGTDGERAIGVFLRETFERMSHIAENGIRFLASSCQQSQISSWVEGGGVSVVNVVSVREEM